MSYHSEAAVPDAMRAWHGRQNVTFNPELIMLPEDRKDAIYRYLFAKRSATIHELATLMAVSAMTIRRDIKFLQEAGLVVGIHGGAMLPAVVHQALPYVEKAQLHAHAKHTGNPSEASSWAIAWLAPDCVMPTCSAAREMLLASATASNKRQCKRFIMMISSSANSAFMNH
ncbi:hypothetical protein E05_11850 [Plautia stali symbiont]|nr:hypothetical protein E05_11850 [Plautia stali symbiont]